MVWKSFLQNCLSLLQATGAWGQAELVDDAKFGGTFAELTASPAYGIVATLTHGHV